MSALCPRPMLVQALRGALREADGGGRVGHGGEPLVPLAQAMARVLDRLERPWVQAAQQEERLRDALLALHERMAQLTARLRADAGLRHAEPERAAAAAEALAALAPVTDGADGSWLPARHGGGAALAPLTDDADGAAADAGTLPPWPELSAEQSVRLLSAAQALLGVLAEPPLLSLRPRLGLEEIVAALAALRAQGAALAARWVAARDALTAGDDEPELSHEEAAAVALLLHYRAYALAATGPLHPLGEQPAERARLLAPLAALPLVELTEALRRYEARHPLG